MSIHVTKNVDKSNGSIKLHFTSGIFSPLEYTCIALAILHHELTAKISIFTGILQGISVTVVPLVT